MLTSIKFFYDDQRRIAYAYGHLSDGRVLKCMADLNSQITYGCLNKKDEGEVVANAHARMAVEMVHYKE